jgi:hypothetical protein
MANSILQDGHYKVSGGGTTENIAWSTTGDYRTIVLAIAVYGTAVPFVSDPSIIWGAGAIVSNGTFSLRVITGTAAAASGTTTVTVTSGSVLLLTLDPFYDAAGATAYPVLSTSAPFQGTSADPSTSITTVNAFDQVLAYEISTNQSVPGAGSGFSSTGIYPTVNGYYDLLGEIASAYTATPASVPVSFSNTSSEPWVAIALALTGAAVSTPSYGSFWF